MPILKDEREDEESDRVFWRTTYLKCAERGKTGSMKGLRYLKEESQNYLVHNIEHLDLDLD